MMVGDSSAKPEIVMLKSRLKAACLTAAMCSSSTMVFAADLPVAPEPVDFVRVCNAFGQGFFYLPGTDTCLRIGGRIRADLSAKEFGDAPNDWDSDGDISIRFRTRGYMRFDSRTSTEYGLLRTYLDSYVQVETGSAEAPKLDHAFIQFGGLTAGRTQSFWDFWTGYTFGVFFTDYTDIKTNLFAYTYEFGNGFSASFSAEDGTRRRANIVRLNTAATSTIATDAYGGHRIPDFVAALRVDQGWGSAQLMGALHNAYYDRTAFGGTADSQLGWAIGAGVEVNVPWASGATFVTELTYTDGASDYAIDSWDSQITDAIVIGNSLETTKTYNIALGYQQPIFTDWVFAIQGGYHSADAPLRAYDFAEWGGDSSITWQPVEGLVIGAEIEYRNRNFTTASGLPDGDYWASTFRVQRSF